MISHSTSWISGTLRLAAAALIAFVSAGCATAPAWRLLTDAESQALFAEKIGTKVPAAPLRKAYIRDEKLTSTDGNTFNCNGAYEISRSHYYELTQFEGNQFKGSLYEAVTCKDSFKVLAFSGRYDDRNVYVRYENGNVHRFSRVGENLVWDANIYFKAGVFTNPVSDGMTEHGSILNFSPLKPVRPDPRYITELKMLAEEYSGIASAQLADREAEKRAEQRQKAAAFNAFLNTLAGEMARNNVEIERGNANLARASAAVNEENRRRARIAELERRVRERNDVSAPQVQQSTRTAGSAQTASRATGNSYAASGGQKTGSRQARQDADEARRIAQRGREAEEAARKQAAQAEAAKRKEEAARLAEERRREEAAKRQAARDAKQREEQEIDAYLAGLRSKIRMGVKSCGKDDVRIGGVMPEGKRLINSPRVHYTVYCPGNASVRGTHAYFIGDGYSCVGSDMLQVKIPCKAEEAKVVVDRVTRN